MTGKKVFDMIMGLYDEYDNLILNWREECEKLLRLIKSLDLAQNASLIRMLYECPKRDFILRASTNKTLPFCTSFSLAHTQFKKNFWDAVKVIDASDGNVSEKLAADLLKMFPELTSFEFRCLIESAPTHQTEFTEFVIENLERHYGMRAAIEVMEKAQA